MTREPFRIRPPAPPGVTDPIPWHRYEGTGPRCTWCGALPDRAIHDRNYALNNGYEFVEARDGTQS